MRGSCGVAALHRIGISHEEGSSPCGQAARLRWSAAGRRLLLTTTVHPGAASAFVMTGPVRELAASSSFAASSEADAYPERAGR